MKKEYSIFVVGISLLIVTIISAIWFISDSNKSKINFHEISVIIRGPQNAYWDAIKQGIDKAALEMNADVSYVTLLEENNANEQLQAVKREIDNGSKAIILAPATKDFFTQIKEKIVIVELESYSSDENVSASIFSESVNMGMGIGKEVVKKHLADKKIVLLTTEAAPPFIKEREEGFLKVLKEKKVTPSIWNIPLNDKVDVIKSKIVLEGVDTIIALDAVSLLNATQAVSSITDCKTEIFGADSTSEIIAFMEKGVINTIAAQNTFNLGYLGVKSAVLALEGKNLERTVNIDYSMINIDNIYTPENQRLLFPFIK